MDTAAKSEPTRSAVSKRGVSHGERRLDPNVWIEGALGILAEKGLGGVAVEPLAKRLGVTKGSFYWHFKDRDALLLALLSQWRRRATLAIIERLERGHEIPEERLRNLLALPFSSPRAPAGAEVELAIRLWGRTDVRARSALKEVDEVRLRYIQRLLEEAGLDAETASLRAVLAYSFMRVASTLVAGDHNTLVDATVVALLVRA